MAYGQKVKVKGHERTRSKVKVSINVKEKAVGLMPTSSCFISRGRYIHKLIPDARKGY